MREFKELRNSSEEQERAAPYVGVARTILGKLKNRMVLGRILQDSDVQTLPDGTVITVTSRMHPSRFHLAQDDIHIAVPAAVGITYFAYEFITVTDIFTSIKFVPTTHEGVTSVHIISDSASAGFKVINNFVGPYPSNPLFGQYQNIWYDSRGDVVASGTSTARYAVKGNRSNTPLLVERQMRYITIDGSTYAPVGTEVIAAAKQGNYLIGITTLGDVIAWKIGEAGYSTTPAPMPAWVDDTLEAFWTFNEEGTKVISTQYAAIDSGWRESGYVEMELAVDDSGTVSVTLGRSKRASVDTRPIIAVDYDYIADSDQIIYATISKEYDTNLPASVFSKYIQIYSNEVLIKEFLIESAHPEYYETNDGVEWIGNVTAMDLRFRSYTWGYSQEHLKSGPNATIAATVKASILNGQKALSSTELFASADKPALAPIEIRGTYPFLLEELEVFAEANVTYANSFAISIHPVLKAWGLYTDFSSAYSSEEVKASLDYISIPVEDGDPVVTTHRALYDSARIAAPTMPEITSEWGTVMMGAASVWMKFRSAP